MLSDRFVAKVSNTIGARGLRMIGKLNVPAYRLSGGRIGNKVGDGPVLLLTTTGRKSGESRTAPILYLEYGEAMILIDTNGGSEKLPGWSYNLRAKPLAQVEIGREQPDVGLHHVDLPVIHLEHLPGRQAIRTRPALVPGEPHDHDAQALIHHHIADGDLAQPLKDGE